MAKSALIGADKTFSDIGTGVEQIFTTDPVKEKQLREQVSEERRLMSKIGSPISAAVGGLAAGVALPGLGAAKVARAVGGIGGAIAGGALGGAAYGSLSPVAEGESRERNAVTGALLGGVVGGSIPLAARGIKKGLESAKRATTNISPTLSARQTFDDFVGDIPTEQLTRAQRQGGQAQAAGINLDLGRAVGTKLAREGQAENLGNVNPSKQLAFENQFNEQVEGNVNRLLNNIASPTKDLQSSLNQFQRVGKKAQQQLFKEVRQQTKPMYDAMKTERVPFSSVDQAVNRSISEDVLPSTSEIVKRRLGTELNKLKSGEPDVSLYKVELLRQRTKELANKAYNAGDNSLGKVYGDIEGDLRTTLSNNSNVFDDTLSRYADDITQAKTQAGEANLAALVNASPERLQQVSQGLLKAPANRINKLRELFTKQKGGQGAWNNIVRQNLEERLGRIRQSQEGNQRLISLMGTPKQQAEIKALLKGNKEAEEIFQTLKLIGGQPVTKKVTKPGGLSVTGGDLLSRAVGTVRDSILKKYDQRRDTALVELFTNPSRYIKEIERIKKLRAPKAQKKTLIQSLLSTIGVRSQGAASSGAGSVNIGD